MTDIGKIMATLPSLAALDAMSQSIAASLEKRRLGKNVIEGDGRAAFEEAAKWIEINRGILQGVHGD